MAEIVLRITHYNKIYKLIGWEWSVSAANREKETLENSNRKVLVVKYPKGSVYRENVKKIMHNDAPLWAIYTRGK